MPNDYHLVPYFPGISCWCPYVSLIQEDIYLKVEMERKYCTEKTFIPADQMAAVALAALSDAITGGGNWVLITCLWCFPPHSTPLLPFWSEHNKWRMALENFNSEKIFQKHSPPYPSRLHLVTKQTTVNRWGGMRGWWRETTEVIEGHKACLSRCERSGETGRSDDLWVGNSFQTRKIITMSMTTRGNHFAVISDDTHPEWSAIKYICSQFCLSYVIGSIVQTETPHGDGSPHLLSHISAEWPCLFTGTHSNFIDCREKRGRASSCH